ncbi:membrane-bound serine protease (ClpP class) [Candidatus Methanoperedens nitroreducens]|uniref:Membrane-bound serine protease (ClpP class) n=1 Tax=Candidatus Methanoperedens nitratireducens TaxID=1392998 RepID=A0A062V730_9EURY|nr:NfeD family protein [Candidatus Methanoperedens nitroreducens]KCZ72373.1 membrane-bound serine protease (ClpP class) [Candidatus Methanoperedens nitroreducens]MDJ1423693.1 NfeD family protein [Candidatus Methanoperedens sp.]
MEIDIGWLMIIVGLVLLIIEASQPGFFVAVPGTILIVLGAIVLLIPEYAQEWAPVIVVITALISSIITIIFYRRIAPGHRPLSTSMDILAGKEGIVVDTIRPDAISGKVRVGNQIWSATGDSVIEAGKKIVVIRSEGVHLKVKEF